MKKTRFVSPIGVLWLLGMITGLLTSPAFSEPPGSTSTAVGAELFERSLSLRELGFENPVRMEGPQAEQRFYFPIPEEVVGLEGLIEIAANGGQALPGVFSGRIDLGGRVARSVSHKENQFDERFTLPLDTRGIRGGFTDLTVRYGVAPSATDCIDPHLPGNYLEFDEQRTRLTYHAPLAAVQSIRAAWTTLPHQPVIWLPSTLDAKQYTAALRAGLLLSAAGMEPRYRALPPEGGAVSAADLTLPEPLARIPRIARLLTSPKAVLNEPADVGAWLMLLAFQPHGLAHVVIDADSMRQPFAAAIQAVEAELPDPVARRVAGWRLALTAATSGTEGNLRLLPWFGQPALAIESRNNQAAVDQLAGVWRQLAGAASQQVEQANTPAGERDELPLTQLKMLPTLAVAEQGAWDIPFTLGALPAGKIPARLTLWLIASPAPVGAAEPVVSVYLNAYLLRGARLTAGEPHYLTVDIPRQVLRGRNLLRIEIARGVGERCQTMAAIPAQILPTSRIEFTAAPKANQFGWLAGQYAHAATLVIPARYLEMPLASLPFIVRLGGALGLNPGKLEPWIVDQEDFTPTANPFLAIGTRPEPIKARAMFKEDWIEVRNDRGQTLYSARREVPLALVELVRAGEQVGAVVELPGADFPDIRRSLMLDQGDFAVLDARGVALELNLNTPLPGPLIGEGLDAWRELALRYRGWLILGAVVLIAIGVLRALRGWFRARAQHSG